MVTALAMPSLAESMSSLNGDDRASLISSLTDRQAKALLHDWKFWARPEQLPPLGNWRTWLVMAGRGFGKTRTGAEWVRESVKEFELVNIVGATADDARDIMIEGESGILAVCPDDERPNYLPSKRRLEWPNGARTLIFTADEPDRLRGKQHMRLWGDEVGAWRYPESWDQAMFGLRLGPDPRCLATTTPKPVMIIRDLIKLIETGEVVVTRGSSYDNRNNLAPAFFSQIIRRYEGTRLGRQELAGELLEDVEGALWTLAMIDLHRATMLPNGVDLTRLVIGIDPSISSTGAETGIVVAGRGSDKRGYVIDDKSRQGSPNEWATAAIAAFDYWKADAVVIEVNQGGEMATNTLKTIRPTLPIVAVHASRGKATRAQPVSALYEQGHVSHVGYFPALEDQMTNWIPGMESPDRMDALVWAMTDLLVGEIADWGDNDSGDLYDFLRSSGVG
jgi:predicted phage terminase large subunit-like protein